MDSLPRSTERIDTVVIGAGQAGLAVGYHLAKRQQRFVILDTNERVGDTWRGRWDSLRVFTPARLSSLPGLWMPLPPASYPTKDQLADYLEGYAARFHLPVRTGVRVDAVSRQGDRYAVASQSGSWDAANIVVATGAYERPRVPASAADLDAKIVQLHSSQYRRPGQLSDGAVLVVGAGNSGAEIAVDLATSGRRVWLSGRPTGQGAPFPLGSLPDRLRQRAFWTVSSHWLTVDTAAGRSLRQRFTGRGHPLGRVHDRDLAAAGIERVPRTEGVRGGRPVLADGRVLDVASVVWCTGYTPQFGWIDLPILDERGLPRQHRGVVESQPGLYFVGLFFLRAFTSSLVGGVGVDAEYVASHIARRNAALKHAVAA